MTRRRLVAALAAMGLLLAAGPAGAIKAIGDTRRDSKRFGKALAPSAKAGRQQERFMKAFSGFNRSSGGKWKIRYNPRTGAPEALIEGESRPRGFAPAAVGGAFRPEQAAGSFLNEERELLGIDPATLVVEKQSRGEGHAHVLYRQTYKGLPVEFSRLKVHLSGYGSIIGANSRYETGLELDVNPALSSLQAADVVLRDGGLPPAGDGALVVFPSQFDGKPHLAWKFTARGKAALWRYYVDAHTGRLLFRYNDLRTICLTSGTVSGMVWEIDPSTSPQVSRPFNGQTVWIRDSNTSAVTGADPVYGGGFFCSSTAGKIFTSLQGPYVNVASFIGPSAHYDNGSGAWTTIATPVSSPHPYPNNALLTSTIDISIPAPNAVKVLPIFSSFHVGSVEAGNDISDDDQLEILGEDNRPIAAYVGNRGAFRGAAVSGRRARLRLRSNAAGQQNGFDVALSSYLTLSAPSVVSVNGSSLSWSAAQTATGKHGEISLFYQINKMHDYFMRDINKSSAAFIGQSVVASAYVGPDIAGAFYNPDYDNLNFGDINSSDPSDALMDDATVSRHEYTHYVVEKIWPIQNFGQAGAVSEAVADYFSASSLDHSAIGAFFALAINPLSGPLRQLDCQNYGPCKSLNVNQNWSGEIHDDSIFLSQALWDIRTDRINALGRAAGQSCADGLVFQSLLYFPESFNEFLDALRRVESAAAVPACGGASVAVQSVINAKFSLHGLGPQFADAFEGPRGNEGFETAVDITTYTNVTASLSPAGDIDFYSFAAGPGPMQITLHLPADGPFFKGYGLTLFDYRHQKVAEALPPLDGFDTFSGRCESHNCTTTADKVVLTFTNGAPGLFFLQIAGGPTVEGVSNSAVNSTVPYLLEAVYPRAAALTGGIVAAAFDRDKLSFSVNVTTFVRTQNYNFARAQLRDHAKFVMPNTGTGDLGSFLTVISSANGLGKISGVLQLQAGFSARFPAVGTVHLEVFGYNVDPDNVRVSTISLGLSQPLNLTANKAELKAYNNVFNPLKGGKATVKYELLEPGHVSLKLYTVSGTLVKTLFDGDAPAGKGSMDWDGANVSGSVVASGIYIIQLDAPGVSKRQKIVVVK